MREDQQHLTKMEEEAIVRWITRIDNYGWPPRVHYVKQMALGFIRSHGVRKPVLGKDCVGLFALPCSFRSPFVDSTCSLYGRPVRAAIQLLLVKLIKMIVIYLD